MEENIDTTPSTSTGPESPRPTAFTIDFGSEKKVDLQRHKSLAEKFQQRHKRGKSMSKLETIEAPMGVKKHPLTGNLPRKSSFQSEDERPERCKSANVRRTDLSLPLENVTSDRMTHSFPNSALMMSSPGNCDLQDVSSPEFELISPFSPSDLAKLKDLSLSSDDREDRKSDTVSETGTYTLEVDNYSEEQKMRMSIDNEFKLEKMTGQEKAEEYLRSLSDRNYLSDDVFTPPLLPVPKPNLLYDKKLLSPILSPTQNLSIVEPEKSVSQATDDGVVISISSSGVFKSKDLKQKRLRNLSLTKSEIHVEAYIDGKHSSENKPNRKKLTANLVNVQSIEVNNAGTDLGSVVSGSLIFGKMENLTTVTTGLPPTPTGKVSPSKIPSPIHTLSRPRSRCSLSQPPEDFDTEMILKPTRNYINSLQQKLSIDNSDQDSDYDLKYGVQLNNMLKQKTMHTRHNSLDDRTINNKLEHFQNKNLQTIDQTYQNVFSQYKVVNKINNSPNDSPIRRSNSFSNRNMNNVKSTNITQNMCSSPNLGKSDQIQRSSSTANFTARRTSTSEHKKIDRSQFGDTESSSEDDQEAKVQKRKDFGTLSNTRCNRTFSLRRARLDNEPKPKCPNTPDMRRKTFQPVAVKPERAISVDRKPVKTNEVQSRYLQLNKRATSVTKEIPLKPTPKPPPKVAPPKPILQRVESGRFSMRNTKSAPPVKNVKREPKNQKQNGTRSNSSLSSREVEFQNWKRRKSYDPMKAAAEGKKKEIEKRLSGLGGKNAASPDSSPSHSGSVHRSQSFHGTAALEQLISSDEDDVTFSADEGFSPPTPSPCELSPAKASLRHSLWDRIHN